MDRPGDMPFIIEKIVDKRTVNGKVEYCLKWEGFNENENTWEEADDIDRTDLIKKYEDDLKERISNHKVYAL